MGDLNGNVSIHFCVSLPVPVSADEQRCLVGGELQHHRIVCVCFLNRERERERETETERESQQYSRATKMYLESVLFLDLSMSSVGLPISELQVCVSLSVIHCAEKNAHTFTHTHKEKHIEDHQGR
jgi:hypothetical protein